VGADPPEIWGRPEFLGEKSDSVQGSHRGIGAGMYAEGNASNTGSPERRRYVAANWRPARDRPDRAGWRIGP